MAKQKYIYELDPKFIGKVYCDKSGVTVLKNLSQSKLKELFLKGNKFVSINEI